MLRVFFFKGDERVMKELSEIWCKILLKLIK